MKSLRRRNYFLHAPIAKKYVEIMQFGSLHGAKENVIV